MKRCHSTSKSEFHSARAAATKTLKNSTQSKDSKISAAPEKIIHTNHHHQYPKSGTSNNKQRILTETISSTNMRLFEEIPSEQVPVKITPKQRSRSTVSDRQPWGYLLNKHTAAENESVFGKFDPLRTLHFLARELQTNLALRLPGETNLLDIVKGMQVALKRIPPEVASTVQLQQLSQKKCFSNDSLDCRSSANTENKSDFGEIQKLIEGSTKKLEDSCKHLENICGDLRDEKISLEVKLQQERNNSKYSQIKMEEINRFNLELTQNLTKKDEEILQLKTTIDNLEAKLQSSNGAGVQGQMTELKKANSYLEQHCLNLEHRLRLCAIEKEKHMAILEVRDRQIYEIRNEMTQLQESVNEQLMELHNYALASLPEPQMEEIAAVWMNNDEDDDFDKKLSDEDLKEGNEEHRMPTRDIF